jgi:hypothetical protein
MRTVVSVACLLAATAVLVQGGLAQSTGMVDVKKVKWAGLADFIKANKGKVIVVDFWADY